MQRLLVVIEVSVHPVCFIFERQVSQADRPLNMGLIGRPKRRQLPIYTA